LEGGAPVGKQARQKDENRQAKEHQLQREWIKTRKFTTTVEALTGLVRTLIRWGGVVLICWFQYRCFQAIAGKDTTFSAVVNLVAKLSIDRWIAYIVAGLASGCWWIERRTRQRTIKEREEYIRELEKKVDPKRSTSGLTATGKPRQEDVHES
jgi:hypothetical protein